MKQTLGALLRDELERRGLSQNQAAKRMGIQQSALSRWILGQSGAPTVENCRAIADFLGMDLLEVMELAGHVPSGTTKVQGVMASTRFLSSVLTPAVLGTG